MSLDDRIDALWRVSPRTYPSEFHKGWIHAEETDNTVIARHKRKDGSELVEAGWYQIDCSPGAEGDKLGFTAEDIAYDEETSFKAGSALMDLNASKVPDSITGYARLGLIKMWHTLPTLASLLVRHFGPIGADDWDTIASWGRVNITSAQIHNFDPGKMFRNVDKVLSYLPDSDTYPLTERAADLIDKVGDAVKIEENGYIIVGIMIALAFAGTILLVWRYH